jgi:hypothetical protein
MQGKKNNTILGIIYFQCSDIVFYQLYHMCGHEGLRGRIRGWGWGQQLVGNGAFESQHRTGVEGSSHPSSEDHHCK